MTAKPITGGVPHPLQWHEGMLLLPQHFQQADHRLHTLLHFHMHTLSPFHWGVSHFRIDPVLLVGGTLRFLELEAVMPDGLIVTRSPQEEGFLELDLKPLGENMALKTLTIHLAVPSYRKGYPNASLSSELPRYRSQEEKGIIDENTGDGDVTVPRLVPQLQLLPEDKVTSAYVSFPILKIAQESNAFVLRPFIPPMLTITLASPLGELCSEIAKRIREKIAFLVERLQSKNSALMSEDTENGVRLLCAGLLPFEAALNSGGSNPYALFILITSLAGQVSGLYPGQMPPNFTAYRHQDLRMTFQQVADYIFAMIDRIQEGYSVLPFLGSDRVFSLMLQESMRTPRIILGARAPVTMSEAQLVDWINNAVMASESLVTVVREKRILGATRQIIQGEQEMKLMPAKGMVLFEIQGDDEHIKGDQPLKIFNVNDDPKKRPMEIVLYLSKKAQEKFF